MSFQVRYFGQHPSVVIGNAYETVSGGGSSDSSDGVNDYGFRTFTPASITDELPSDYVRGFGFSELSEMRRDPTSDTSGPYETGMFPYSYSTTPALAGGTGAIQFSAGFDHLNTGYPIEKVAQAAINGLPPLDKGFLDSESPFLNRYQQRYLTTRLTDEIAGGEGLKIKVEGSSLNYDLGGDADDDTITFESYLQEYATTPYTGLMRRVTRLANKNVSGFRRPHTAGATAFGATAFSEAISGGIIGGETIVYDFAPLVETTFSDRSRPLVTDEWFRTGTAMSSDSYKFQRVTFGSGGGMIPEMGGYAIGGPGGLAFFPFAGTAGGGMSYGDVTPTSLSFGGTPAPGTPGGASAGTAYGTGTSTLGSKPINKNTPFITHASTTSATATLILDQTVYFDYQLSTPGHLEPADRYKITSDIESRFRTERYVNNFSSALISDRIDKITALLGVNVDREADIKMQKNSPLSYNAISSIVAELQPADGSPATAVSRPDLTPDSAGPHGGTVPSLGAMPDGGVTGGGFGDDPESIGPTGLPGVSVTTY